MNFPKDSYIYWSYVLFNTLVLFFSLGFMGKNNPNRFGIYMMVFAAAVTSAELIAWFLNVNILVQPILGDMSWIAVFIYVLNKIKKRVASG